MTIPLLSSSEFISYILDDVYSGKEFIPLIGSGFSASSGILMGQDFTDYLAYVFHRVLAPTISTSTLPSIAWNLQLDGWPRYPSEDDITKAHNWIFDRFTALCNRLKLEIHEENGSDSRKRVRSISPKRTSDFTTASDLLHLLKRPRIPAVLRSSYWDAGESALQELTSELRKKRPPMTHHPIESRVNTSETDILEQGLRSLGDWRETLTFLAQLRFQGHYLCMHTPDASVRDSFNSYITRDRRPNLGHRMLAHLATPLRIRLVLTTNFDTLLEDAFDDCALRLKLIPVSTHGGLPDPLLVRSYNSLIKLHGDLLDTRADLSLDSEPSIEDRVSFARYFRADRHTTPVDPILSDTMIVYHPLVRRLLVIGYSGADRRCISLLKHLLDTDGHSRSLRIYWVCFADNDVQHVRATFDDAQYIDRISLHLTGRPDLLLYELYQRSMLGLPPGGSTYEFSHHVPPSLLPRSLETPPETCEAVLTHMRSGLNLINAARHTMPAVARATEIARDTVVHEAGRALFAELAENNAPSERLRNTHYSIETQSHFARDGSKGRAIQFIISSGAVRSLRYPFIEHSKGRTGKCVWFELQDYPDVDSLSRDIIRVIALRVGQFQLQHVTLHPIRESFVTIGQRVYGSRVPKSGAQLNRAKSKLSRDDQFKQLVMRWQEQFDGFRVDASHWTVFLYGRDAPGANSGWRFQAWDQQQLAGLCVLLHALVACGFCVVHVPLTENRSKRKSQQLNDVVYKHTTDQKGDESQITCQFNGYNAFSRDVLNTQVPAEWPLIDGDHDDSIHNASDELSAFNALIDGVMTAFIGSPHAVSGDNNSYARIRFLYAFTLFRQSRHPSALFSEGTYPCPFRYNTCGIDNDWVRARESMLWIKTLRMCKVLFEKPGGYLWMHRDMRLGVRRRLEVLRLDHCTFDDAGEHNCAFLGEIRARTHFWIGDWYFKAFAASGHVTPLVESIFHRLQAARYAQWARPRALSYADGKELLEYRAVLFKAAMFEVAKTLEVSRHWLKMWLANPIQSAMWNRNAGLESLQSEAYEWAVRLKHNIVAPKADATIKPLTQIVEGVIAKFNDVGEAINSEGGGGGKINYSAPRGADLIAQSCREAPLSLPPVSHDVKASAELDKSAFGRDFHDAFKCIDGQELFRCVHDSLWSPNLPDTYEESLSRSKAGWLLRENNDAQSCHAMIWLLSEYTYLLIRRAKMEYHASDVNALSIWRQVCIVANVGLDFCNQLPVAFMLEDYSLRIKLHALYSAGLANLGRTHEAHRHLNDGMALLSKTADAVNKPELAILCLRRAEVFIAQCYWIRIVLDSINGGSVQLDELRKNGHFESSSEKHWMFFDAGHVPAETNTKWASPDIRREIISEGKGVWPAMISECMRYARDTKACAERLVTIHNAALDDAWIELDRAERCLSGESHSTLWWGRLTTLRLRIYGALKGDIPRMRSAMVFRKERGDEPIAQWCERALRVTSFDVYRRARVVDYYCDARQRYVDTFGVNMWSQSGSDCKVESVIVECEQEAERNGLGLVKVYVSRVKRKVNAALAKKK